MDKQLVEIHKLMKIIKGSRTKNFWYYDKNGKEHLFQYPPEVIGGLERKLQSLLEERRGAE